MKLFYFSAITFLFFIFLSFYGFSQTSTVTVTYTGGMAQGGCYVCGSDYWCINNTGGIGTTDPCDSRTFFDPVPPGHVVTNVTINYWTASCYGAALSGDINGFSVPVTYDGTSGCLCDASPCALTTSTTGNYPCGMPGYVYNGNNTFQICASTAMCINRAEMVFSYVDPDVITPSITPSGPLTFCPGGSVNLDAGSGYSAINWSTGQTSQIITVSTSGTYSVTVTSTTGCTTGTSSVNVSVYSPSGGGIASSSPTSVCYNASSAITLAGYNGSIQWQSSPDNATWSNIPGATTASYNTPPLTSTMYYHAVVTSGPGCASSTSSTASVNVNPQLVAGNITGYSTPICYNVNPGTLTSNPSGGTGTNTINWYNSGGTYLGSGTTFNLGNLTASTGGYYTVSNNCGTATSASILITVFTQTVINSATNSNVSFCGGSDGTISIDATGTQPLYYSINGGGSFVANGGAFSGLPNGNYPVAVRDNNGCIVNGPTLVVQDGGAPPSPSAGSNATYCIGAPISDLWAAALNGGNIRWYSDPTLFNFIGSGNILTPFNTIGTTSYYITETVNGCESSPSMVTITINPIPSATATPSSEVICSGGNTGISLSSSVPNTNFSWSVAQAGVTGGFASSGAVINQTLNSQSTGIGTVVYTITPVANGCTGSTINANITVNPIPDVIANPASQTICSDATTGISLSSNISGTGYSWTVAQVGVTGGFDSNGSTISQALSATSLSQGSAIYTITPSANSCNGASVNVIITVNPLPDISANPPFSTICSGTTTGITLNSSVSGTGYSWTVNQTGVTGAFNGSGINISQILNNSGISTGTAVYTVTPNASSCNGSPMDVTVTVNPVPDVIASPLSQTICSNSSTNINLSSTVSGTTFSWTYSTVDVINASDGSGTNISQILTDTGSAPANVTYIITPSYNTCNGSPLNVDVTVNPYPLVFSSNSSDTICSGNLTNILFSSNVPSATFSWSVTENGVSGGSASGGNTLAQTLNYIASPATATYIITPSANSCTGPDDTVTIYVNPAPVIISEDTTFVSICGGSDGTITITASGYAPLEYSIDGGTTFVQNGGSFTNLSLGSYSVAVKNGLGCITTGSTLTIADVGAPPPPVAGNDTTYCLGDTMSDIFATPGFGGFISWYSDPGLTNLLATSSTLAPFSTAGSTTYYATETTGGCESTPVPIIITINELPVLTPHPATQSICSGQTSSITLTSNQPGATYSWTVTEVNVSGATADTGMFISQTLINDTNTSGTATYSVIATVNGCGSTPQDIVVTVNPIPDVQLNLSITDVCQDVLTVALSGGTPITGTYSGVGVSANNFVPSIAGLGSQIITYTYEDVNNCTGSATDTITVHSLPNVNLSTIQPVCANSSSFTLTNGTPPGGTYYGNGIIDSIFDPVNAGIGTHTITYIYSDSYGCSNSAVNNLTVAPLPVADINLTTPVSCHDMTDGTATVTVNGGTQPYSYQWDNNPPGTGQTATGLNPDYWYHVTVTDVNGCIANDSIQLINPPQMLLSTQFVNPTCGMSNGYVEVNVTGGTNPYSYHWNYHPDSVNHSLSNIPAAVYFVTVTDSQGCFSDTLISLTTTPFVSATFFVTNVSCFGGSNGSITTSMTGGTAPFNYLWSNGQTTNSISGLTVDTLSILITDSKGCTFNDTVVVSQSPELILNLITTDVKCFGETGTIATAITGGTQPYTYHWNTNYVGPTLTGIANTYSVTVTDFLGCTALGSETLYQPSSPLNVTLSSDSAKCFGAISGSADVLATGGTGPYTYIWNTNPIQTNPHAINLNAGNYIVTVTDNNICHVTGTIEVFQPSRIDIDSVVTPTSCEEGDDGKILIHTSGGKPPYLYLWFTDPIQTDTIAGGLYHGFYDVKITDSRQCYQIYTIEVPNTPVPCLIIPTVFTPNADGVHDLWNIKNLYLYPYATIEVYNRWGSPIYTAGTNDKRWDGKYNGEICPSGSYVFIINLNNGTEAKQGIVTIIR